MTPLEKFCEASLRRKVPDELRTMATHLRAKHPGTVAVLAYGSCLRGIAVHETLMDFYLLTDNLNNVSHNIVSRLACAMAPPNVYYAETAENLRAKYAVLPLSLFAKWVAPETRNPYFWARFSQPSALVYTTDESIRRDVIAAIATALETSYANALATTSSQNSLTVWASGFKSTYATEFRPENSNRAAQIVEAYPEYYAEASQLLAHVAPRKSNRSLQRTQGKLWSTLRLLKAAFTFQGGASYVAWKIERHTGEKIVLTDWQKRHPILAGFMLLGPLLRKGAVR
jgi:hypothetical protein